MPNFFLTVQKRERVGHSLKALRRQGVLPAVIYGRHFEALPIQLPLKNFEAVYRQAGASALVEVELENQKLPVLLHEVALDPLGEHPIHADFYQVSLHEKITADIPLIFSGESPAVKEQKGILVKNMQAVKVEALPGDLPSRLIVDLSALKSWGEEFRIENLAVPGGVVIKEDPRAIIVLIQEPISEEELQKELAVSAGEAEEVEVIKKEEKTEGEEEVKTEEEKN